MAGEIRTLPVCILDSLRAQYPRNGLPINMPDLSGYEGDASSAGNTFLYSCSDGMQHLQQGNRWAGVLDQQMAAEAYRLGAEWAVRTLRSGS